MSLEDKSLNVLRAIKCELLRGERGKNVVGMCEHILESHKGWRTWKKDKVVIRKDTKCFSTHTSTTTKVFYKRKLVFAFYESCNPDVYILGEWEDIMRRAVDEVDEKERLQLIEELSI